MAENVTKLSVQMLGGFHMYWGNREVRIKSGSSTKAAHILQLVLFNAPERVPTDTLTREVFAGCDLLDPNNNLKASLTLLRKQLLASGLPRSSYITFRDRGYIWTEELPPELDTTLFENAVQKALRANDERAIKPCMEACRLYGGRFLPELEGYAWVEEQNLHFSELYVRVLERLAGLMTQAGRQEELLPYLERACKLMPREEWETMRMRCLMELGRWDDAKQVYIDAVGNLARDQDIQPPAELTAQYKKLSKHLVKRVCSLREIVDYVREENIPDSAYCCTFPGFVDAARIAIRGMARVGRPSFLVLCTLLGINGDPISDSDRLEDASEKLGNALGHSMRRSDFYTLYNLSQYLIFLQGTELDNCEIVQNRIEHNFRAMAVRGVRLKFEVYTANLKALDQLAQQEED